MYKSLVFFLILVAAGAGIWFLTAQPGVVPSDAAAVNRVTPTPPSNSAREVSIEEPPSEERVDRPSIAKSGPFPQVVIGETVYPFGRMEVSPTATRQHTFELKNIGEADLVMTTSKPTCKCTTFGFGVDAKTATKKAVVKPGESINVVIGWKSGEEANRAFRHGGSVYTNDPKNSEIKYAVEGSIEVSFELLPQVWTVGNVFSTEPARFRGSLASKVHTAFEIESAASQSGKVKITWEPMALELMAREGYLSGWTFNAEVSSDIPVGLFEDKVEIRIKGRQDPLVIPLTARRHGQIRLQQMAGTAYDADKILLQMGTFSPKEGRESKLLLIVDEKDMTEPFQLKEKKSDPSFVTATLEPLGAPTGTVHRYVLKIAVPPGRPQAHKTVTNPGYIEVATNHPTGESIKMGLLLYSH